MPRRIIRYSRYWLGEHWYLHYIALAITLALTPIVWMAFDRTPPFIRLKEGSTVVEVPAPPNAPIELKDRLWVAVRYVTTRPVRPEGDCPGIVQQEFLDEFGNFSSKYAKETGPARWEEDPSDPNHMIFTGRPILVPDNILGSFVLTTVTFRYCNFVQRILYWPIEQNGPPLVFKQEIPPAQRNPTRLRLRNI
jgi:hypothetical protein